MSVATTNPVAMTEDEARRLTERIRYTALGVRDGVEKLQRLVAEAQEGQAHVALGYKSWTAYLADVMGDEPLVLARDQRRDVVAWLAGEGMSTRAIAPIVGADFSTVSRDLSRGVASATPDADPQMSVTVVPEPRATESTADEAVTDDPASVAGSEPQGEATVPSRVATAPSAEAPRPAVIGMDGKTYVRPNRAPAPRRERTDVVVEISKALNAAEEAAHHAERITAAHLANRHEEATVWTRRLSAALESLERLNTSLKEASL